MLRPILIPPCLVFLVGAALAEVPVVPVTVKTDVRSEPKAWPSPDLEAVRQELADWLDKEVSADLLSSGNLLEGVVTAMRQNHPRHSESVSDYLNACDALAWQELPFGQKLVLPKVPLQVFVGDGSTQYLHGALRHYLAERLVQARLFDESRQILEEMTPENSLDPAGVLLLRAVVCNQLSLTEKGLEAIQTFNKTVENGARVSRRSAELAKLLEFELEQQKEEQEGPQNISRRMNDVRRRLGKGRTDEGTQKAEKDVMKSLDKLIEKIEEQAKKQGQSSEGDQGRQGNQAADDSRILKQKGPGNVDRREFDPAGDWGELPPKERGEILLKIEKEFPPHYRDMIEQYFREMATERTDD